MALNLTNLDCANDSQHDQYSSMSLSNAKLRFSPGITILIYIIYFIPFCFGVFGNISVCLIFFQQKKLRSITNTFLMNLCLNDLIVLCVSIPMTLSAALLEHWVFGAFLCKFVNFTPTLTALVSTFTVAIIAVERWFFIVNKQKFDRHCTIVTLILLWIVSILIALPEFLLRQLQDFMPLSIVPYMMKNYPTLLENYQNNTNMIHNNNYYMMKAPCKMKKIFYCVLKPDLRMRIFSYTVITVQYLVPFLFVSVSCYSISRFLKRRMKRMRAYQTHSRPTRNSKKINRKKKRLASDEITEQDFTSYDGSTTMTDIHENKSNYFLTRFRQTFQNHESFNVHNSFQLNDHQHYLKTQSHTKRRFHRSRKLLICVAALFTISWLPLTITQIYLEHNEEILYSRDGANFVYGYLLIPCYLISSLSAWINPVIYNYINRSFRREFYALYSCCFKVAPSSSTIGGTTTTTAQKEFTSIAPKKSRKETIETDPITTPPISRSTIKHSVPVVSFSDETIVMMHRHS